MNRLDGRVALISGGAKGIGAETARLMVEAGARVVIGDVLEAQGRRTAEELGEACAFVPLDVTSEESWRAAVDLAVERFGRLDVLVNNAGLFLGTTFEEVSLADWQRLMDVNLTGTVLGIRVCADALRAAGQTTPHGSAIVNLSSIAGLIGSNLDPLYSMTKGGVTTFTKSMALYFGRRGEPVRVNAIHPGVIETDMGEQTYATRAAFTGSNDVERARSVSMKNHPIGRHGTPEDIAKGILFLASDDAGFMTGSSLVVDGGFTAQ